MSPLRPLQPRGSRRIAGLIIGAGIVVMVLAATLLEALGHSHTTSVRVLKKPAPAATSMGQHIAAIAESQVGYSASPSDSYCNKFSAYWGSGTADCPSGEMEEGWCSDFAAWVWQMAGVHFAYGYGPGQINGAAVSFYEWAVANGQWHPATTGYVAAPGDVAVYGLSLGADPSAVHVAIVTNDPRGQRGPDVVNGNDDRTGYSVVDTGTDQVQADVGQGDSTLAGYVSPPQ